MSSCDVTFRRPHLLFMKRLKQKDKVKIARNEVILATRAFVPNKLTFVLDLASIRSYLFFFKIALALILFTTQGNNSHGGLITPCPVFRLGAQQFFPLSYIMHLCICEDQLDARISQECSSLPDLRHKALIDILDNGVMLLRIEILYTVSNRYKRI